MKILSIIPARKNSKRIKNKNKILIKNKMMIEHTFLVAKKSKIFTNIMLTSDDEQIIKLAKKYEILAPWLRPKNLSNDFTPSYKVILHAYEWYENNYEKVDGIFILQPTSPFRKLSTIMKMVKIFKNSKKKSVINISKCNEHPEWMVKLRNNRMTPYMSSKYFKVRSQSLKKLYRINGLGYLISPSILKKEKTLVPRNSIPCINYSKIESIDIDDFEDYILAKNLI